MSLDLHRELVEDRTPPATGAGRVDGVREPLRGLCPGQPGSGRLVGVAVRSPVGERNGMTPSGPAALQNNGVPRPGVGSGMSRVREDETERAALSAIEPVRVALLELRPFHG